MNELIVSAALKTLNVGDVSELTEEKITEIVERIESLKVYDEAGLTEFKSNVRKDFRQTIEGEVKGKAYEKIEKDILQKFGLELEKGTDYNTALELIEKAKQGWLSDSSNDETLTKELSEIREKLKQVNEDKDKSINTLTEAHKKTLSDMVLNSEISKFSGLLDAEDSLKAGQLEFLKFQFDKVYELRTDAEGKTVVFDKVKDEVVKNETDFSPESLSSVLGKLAPTIVKLKKDEAKTGRGNDNNNKPAVSNVAKFKTNEDLNQYLTGQGISPASIEGQQLYSEWKKAQ